MKKVIRTLIGIGILILGLFIFLYPDYREWKLSKEVRAITEMVQITKQPDNIKENSVYENDLQIPKQETETEDVKTSEKSAQEELYEWFREYNLNLTSNSHRSSEKWDFAQSPIGSDAIGYVEIPEISLTLPLYIGATDMNMSNGAVVLSGTSMPIGGQGTNCVIAAHRGWRGSPYFRDVDRLKIGSEVIIHNLWDTLFYQVTGISIVHETEEEILKIQPEKDMVTLFSCYPYMSSGTAYRLVIFCERENIQKENQEVETGISVKELIEVELEEKEIVIEETFTENLPFTEDRVRDILPKICILAAVLIAVSQIIRKK